MRYCTVGETITETTRSIVVMQLSAHLFKTAGASTAAVYGGDNPHLASAILHHKNALITEQNYSSSKSMTICGLLMRSVLVTSPKQNGPPKRAVCI
jgi:hypothetical protein